MTYVATIWVLAPALRCICECGRVFALPLNCTAPSNAQSFLWQIYTRSNSYFCSAYLHGIFLTFLLSPSQRLRDDVRVYWFRDMLYHNIHTFAPQVEEFMHAHALAPGAFVAVHLRRGHKYMKPNAIESIYLKVIVQIC